MRRITYTQNSFFIQLKTKLKTKSFREIKSQSKWWKPKVLHFYVSQSTRATRRFGKKKLPKTVKISHKMEPKEIRTVCQRNSLKNVFFSDKKSYLGLYWGYNFRRFFGANNCDQSGGDPTTFEFTSTTPALQ
jgi:hypothetical protein